MADIFRKIVSMKDFLHAGGGRLAAIRSAHGTRAGGCGICSLFLISLSVLFLLCGMGVYAQSAETDNPRNGEEVPETDNPQEEPSEHSHRLVKIPYKAPTCEDAGNVEYWVCEDCERCFSDETGADETEITDRSELLLPKLSTHQWDRGVVIQQALCTKAGKRQYTCTVCKTVKTEQIAARGHQYADKLTQATTKKNGKVVNKCKLCGNVRRTTVIPAAKKITLSKTSYAYNGKQKAPKVTVRDAKGKKISTKYYTVKNAKAKNVGTHSVKIVFRGRYKGTVTKKYKILPMAEKITGLTPEKHGFTVKYQKQKKQCSGYQLQYAKNRKFSSAKRITLKRNSSKKKISGLENSTKYYVRIRAYTKVKENGKYKTYYSAWSKVKQVRTKDVKLICIDAGHQQRGDSSLEPVGPGASTYKAKVAGGTSGVVTGKPEYMLTLEIALQLQGELEKRGYDVIMVRTTNDVNISNSERAGIANFFHADAFIRIHANGSANRNASGAMTICQTPGNIYNGIYYAQSRRLSDEVLNHVVAACGCRRQYVWETDSMSGINWCSVPVTILEMGYMTNPSEDALLSNPFYQAQMVQGIANGIDAYFGR